MAQDITAKNLFFKLLLLIFIIFFVTGYSAVFGDANLLMGVMIITGLLMFDKMDIGIHVKQAPFLIVVLHLQKGMWIATTVFSIMQPDFQLSKIRVKQRIIGTLITCTCL